MSKKKGILNLPNTPQYIVLHCSATSDNPNSKWYGIGEPEINEMHKARFRPSCENGIKVHTGYHYVIKKDGTLEVGKSEDHGGQHASGINTKSIGICLIGKGDAKLKGNIFYDSTNGIDQNVTSAQKSTLKKLVHKLMVQYKISSDNVIGHHDVYMLKRLAKLNNFKMLKTCPSFSVRQYMTSEFIKSGTYGDGEYMSYERSAN